VSGKMKEGVVKVINLNLNADISGFKAACAMKRVSMTEVIRRLVAKVGAGDTALLERIVK